MPIFEALNSLFTTRVWPLPAKLEPLPAQPRRGTRCVIAEELGYDVGLKRGVVCVWRDADRYGWVTVSIGLGLYCIDKKRLRLAPKAQNSAFFRLFRGKPHAIIRNLVKAQLNPHMSPDMDTQTDTDQLKPIRDALRTGAWIALMCLMIATAAELGVAAFHAFSATFYLLGLLCVLLTGLAYFIAWRSIRRAYP